MSDITERLRKKVIKLAPVAQSLSELSKDPDRRVAAVAFDDDLTILSVGYNGPPRGVEDLPERLTRPGKYEGWVSHAEENMVAQAARVGVSLKGQNAMVTALKPCSTCTRLIIQSGIKRLFVPDVSMSERWSAEWETSRVMLGEAGVEVVSYRHDTN